MRQPASCATCCEQNTQFESGENVPNWRILPALNEVLWFSERDDWGQLYLYDLATGALKQQVTSGTGNVQQVIRVDEKARLLWFTGVGKEATGDPYFRVSHWPRREGSHTAYAGRRRS
jgi:dipeptidyl-peptidase-4